MIPRLEHIDRDRFEEEFVLPGKPAILTRALDGWGPLSWTPEWVVSQAPERAVELSTCTNWIFDFDHQQNIFGSRIERVKRCSITSGTLLVVVGAGQIAADTGSDHAFARKGDRRSRDRELCGRSEISERKTCDVEFPRP